MAAPDDALPVTPMYGTVSTLPVHGTMILIPVHETNILLPMHGTLSGLPSRAWECEHHSRTQDRDYWYFLCMGP